MTPILSPMCNTNCVHCCFICPLSIITILSRPSPGVCCLPLCARSRYGVVPLNGLNQVQGGSFNCWTHYRLVLSTSQEHIQSGSLNWPWFFLLARSCYRMVLFTGQDQLQRVFFYCWTRYKVVLITGLKQVEGNYFY